MNKAITQVYESFLHEEKFMLIGILYSSIASASKHGRRAPPKNDIVLSRLIAPADFGLFKSSRPKIRGTVEF